MPAFDNKYIFVRAQDLILDGLGLEPSEGVSVFLGGNSHTVEVGIILIDLTVGVDPSISNDDTSKSYLFEEG